MLRKRENEARLEACEQTLAVDERELNLRETRLLILEQELQSQEEVVISLMTRIKDSMKSDPSPQPELEAQERQADEDEALVTQLEASTRASRDVVSRTVIEIAPEQEPNADPADDPWQAPEAPEAEVAQASPEAPPAAPAAPDAQQEESEAPKQAAPLSPEEAELAAERAERARDRAQKFLGLPTWVWTTGAFAVLIGYIVVISAAFLPERYAPSWGPALRQVIEGDQQQKLEEIQKRNAELERLKKEEERQEDLTR